MRISDWSSDVCSSDLAKAADEMVEPAPVVAGQHAGRDAKQEGAADGERHHGIGRAGAPDDARQQVAADAVGAQQVLRDRKSVVEGKSVTIRVDPGGSRLIQRTTRS